MKISVITLFPKMISGFFNESIVKKAKEKGLVEIELIDLRKFAIDKRGTVDDRPYGGGTGMILRVDVIYKALQQIIKSNDTSFHDRGQDVSRIILTSPKGKVFNQQLAINYSKLNHLIIIAGHYEGVDERILDFVDEEVSLGDFILTGGEIVASAIADATVRLLPGVLKKSEVTKWESFFTTSINRLIDTVGDNKYLTKLKNKGVKNVKLLEYPQYTRPEEFDRKKVPEILLSGDHKKIEDWRLKKAFEETVRKRPNLLR